MTKLQSPISALERPRCPRCEARMPLISAARDPEGFDHRIFKCDKCGLSRTVKVPDPMKSTSAGWLAGELKPADLIYSKACHSQQAPL